MEEIRGDDENFPVGLRVLAVDDDPTCLKLLETLLRKCLYTVTTTNQARIALNMIREDKDRFDLVISDVYMPDMDGFKLLELVGLEMDLPVIMLSANSDPKLVMKGITHGACDYLVKPVRIEELKNVWQHVIRRKKFDSTNQNRSSDKGKAPLESGEDPGPLLEGNTDHNVSNRKRKDDDDDDSEDYGNECDEPGAQKRPRVVWSLELHRKFVAAVNHLGIEKAVPKRILDIMNDEGLTRENVASHLQKYRLYLKRISGAANQQGNAGAALGVKDALFMPVGRMSNVALSPYTNGGMLGRLTGPGNVNLRNLTPTTLVQPSRAQNLSRSTNPSTLVQPGRDQNLSSSTNLLRQMHPVLPNSSQNPGLFQETQSSLKLDQLQQSAVAANFNAINNSRMLRTASTFSDTGAVLGSSNNLLNSSMRNPLMLHGNAQQPLTGGGFRGQSAHGIALTSESFNTGVYGSSNLLDPGKFNENWQNTVETSEMHPNPLLAAQPFYSSNGPYEQINSVGLPSPMALPAFGDSRAMQCQVGSMADLQNMSQVPGQSWLEQRQNYGNSSQFPGDGITRNLGQSSGFMNQNMDNFENSSASMQQNDDSVEELLNSMFTREHDETMGNGEFGFDDYSFGAHPC